MTNLLIFLTLITILAAQEPSKPSEQNKIGDAKVLGIPVGEKFVVPQCEYTVSNQRALYKDFLPKRTCYTRGVVADVRTIHDPLLNNVVTIKFSRDETPLISKRYNLSAIVLNENLEGVWFDTNGLSAQKEIFEVLKSKYGNPTKFEETEVKNMMGAAFSSMHARWTFDNISVEFHGVTSDFGTGKVSVFTKKGMEWQEQKEAEEKAKLKL